MNADSSDSTARVAPLTTRSQTNVVVDEIKRMLIEGVLQAGSRLPVEKELAEALAVSRGSLREGVRALCIMGVLETRQGDGTYVTSLDSSLLLAPMGFMVDLQTPAENAHLQAVRRILETEAVASAAARISDADLAKAAAILSDVESIIDGTEETDHERLLNADIAFHRLIATASENPVLEALIEVLASKTARGRLWRSQADEEVRRHTHSEHLAIWSALKQRNAEHAKILMAHHLLGAENFFYEHPQPAAEPATSASQP